MRHARTSVSRAGSVLVALLLAVGPAPADAEPTGSSGSGTARGFALQGTELPGMVWGSVRSQGRIGIGIRGVSQNGSESRFAKDVDLDSGVRMLDTHWVLSPADRNAERWFDRAVIDIDGAGGDPYEYYAVSLAKNGSYRLDARARKADFKWSIADSHNVWDTTRWYTDVRLAVTPVRNLDLYAVYDRYSQHGDNEGTVDISRNEFVVDLPANTTSQSWALGARYKRNRTSVFFEQEFSEFEDVMERSSGPNTGLTPDEAELDAFQEQQVRSINAPVTRAGASTWLADDRVRLTGDVMYSKQDMNFAWDSIWSGLNFQRRAVIEAEGSNGLAEREVLHGNVFGGFKVNRNVQATARFRHRSWDQTGDRAFTISNLFADGAASLAVETASSIYEITHDQILFGAKGMFRSGSAYGEVGYSNREQIFESPVADDNVDTTGVTLRVGGSYRPNRMVDIKANFDYSDIDDPFTRISPSEVNAFRVRVNTRPVPGLLVGGHYRYRDVKNTVTDFEFTQNGVGVHAAHQWGARSYFTAAYTRNDIDQQIPITFIFPFFGNRTNSTALQDLATDVFTVAADVAISDTVPLTVYGSASLVGSDSDEAGVVSSSSVVEVVRLDFYDLVFGARYVFTRSFFVDGTGRYIDYQEGGELILGVDDYDAAIFTLQVGFIFD